MEKQYNRLKLACYSANMSMSVVSNLSPLLFLTFRMMYGVSYSQLGLLVLVNFCTQLAIDLVFSFFSHKFNIAKTVKTMPWLTFTGLLVYAVWPFFFPENVYEGLLIGTVIFSSSGGLGEVLISPVIASIPSDDPDREMSKLHSVYAWGVVGVVVISTLFLLVFGRERWQYLAILFMMIPFVSALLYHGAEIPHMETPKKTLGALSLLKNSGLWLCVAAIFFGGAAECTMAQWSSSYLEQVFCIPKVWGDVFGVALFSVMLGLGRTLYGKYGKNITKVLLLCAVGSAICYFVSAVSVWPIIGLIACALTGICTSMLWPGNLIVATERFPAGGVFVFALMASGGDMGAAAGSQLVGFITDIAISNSTLTSFAHNINVSPEQFGMKLGMIVGMLFSLMAAFIILRIRKQEN